MWFSDSDVFFILWCLVSMALGAGVSRAIYRWFIRPKLPGRAGGMISGLLGTMTATALLTTAVFYYIRFRFDETFYFPLGFALITFGQAASGAIVVLPILQAGRGKPRESEQETSNEYGGEE